MNPETLAILDQSVQIALLAFLASFAGLFGYAAYRQRTRRIQLEEYYARAVEEPLRESQTGEVRGLEAAPRISPNRVRTAWHALLLSAGTSLLVFLIAAFTPLPFLHNFATETGWKIRTLQLANLKFERFQDGFSVEAEVWNRSEEPLEKVDVLVEVIDDQGSILGSLQRQVEPLPLAPGESARFQLRYEDSSPLLYGYRIAFIGADGSLIPHSEGSP